VGSRGFFSQMLLLKTRLKLGRLDVRRLRSAEDDLEDDLESFLLDLLNRPNLDWEEYKVLDGKREGSARTSLKLERAAILAVNN
jgi:hypothetical protein